MYNNVTKYMFRDTIMNVRPDNFSYEGLSRLYDHLILLEFELTGSIEFDPIAICCEYSEDNLKDVLENYSLDSINDLMDNTWVIELDADTIIYIEY